jgi:tRNA(Ile)-lysidine synthase
VAVSGGPDSLCLLHLLHTLAPELKIRMVVAHLNHRLRPEAHKESVGVAGIASAWSLPFETKAVDIRSYKKKHRLSEEEAGRRARYRFLFAIARKYKASVIALGHHLDDQAETVLLNVLRGSSVDGLAGILPKRARAGVKLVRPLLCLRRIEIEEYCDKHNLQPYTDSSNLETDYTRNKLRLELIPYLEKKYNPKIRETLISLSSLASADRHFLNYLARKKLAGIACTSNKNVFIDLRQLKLMPLALRSRILRLALYRFIPAKKISRVHIEQLLDLAENSRPGRQVTLPGGIRVHHAYDRLVIAPLSGTAKMKFEQVSLAVPGTTVIGRDAVISARVVSQSELNWPPPANRAYLDYDKLSSSSLTVRMRRPGDRFYPQGAPGSKKLKSFLIDRKIPLYRRDSLPLVVCGDEIIWVAGLRIAHPYRVTGHTGQVLMLEFKTVKSPEKKSKSHKNQEANNDR